MYFSSQTVKQREPLIVKFLLHVRRSLIRIKVNRAVREIFVVEDSVIAASGPDPSDQVLPAGDIPFIACNVSFHSDVL